MKNNYTYWVTLLIVLLLFLPIVVNGQACCSAGVPLLGSLELPGLPAGDWHFALTYDMNSLQDVVAESNRLDDHYRTRTVHTGMLETNYGLTNRWSISMLFSMLQQNRSIQSPINPSMFDRLTSQGIGDAVLLFKYSLSPLNAATQREVTIGGGSKVPLGRYDLRTQNGILIPSDMQPGTGAWDTVLWAYFYQGFLPFTRFTIFGNISTRFTGTNKFDYKFGNEFISTLSTAYRTDTPFDFSLSVRYRFVTPDQRFEHDIANTGGQWLVAIPGINLKPATFWSMRLAAHLPLYRKLNGTQLTTSYRFSASLFFLLQKPKGIIQL